MRYTVIMISFLVLLSFNVEGHENHAIQKTKEQAKHAKIKVLNFGTFHFGPTPDAHSTEFDEEDKSLHKDVRAISKMIAKFRPTIICVESLPEENEKLNELYQQFLKQPSELITSSGETSMIAFDVARLNDIEQIYGIDNHMGYNYSVGDFIESSPELTNSIDPETYLEITNQPFKNYPELAALDEKYESLSLLDKLKFIRKFL